MTDNFSTASKCVIGTVLLLGATLAASRDMAYRRADPLAQPLDAIDRDIAGFIGVDNPSLDQRVVAQLRPSSYLGRTYRKPGLSLDLFIAFYAQQRAGENMHSPKHCLPGAGWEIWDYGRQEIPVAGRPVSINRYSISRDGERMVVLYWYQSKHRIIASEYLGKILLARDALFRSSTAGSIVRITVPDTPAAVAAATTFATELVPRMQRCFGR